MIRKDKVHHGKVEEVLPTFPDESVNLIVADPPFNKGKNYHGYSDNLPQDEYLQWVENWIAEGFRILKKDGLFWIYCSSDLQAEFAIIAKKYGIWQNTIVWHYEAPTPSKTRFPKTWSPWQMFSKTKDFKFFSDFEKVKSFRSAKRSAVYDVWYDIPKLTGGYLAQNEVILKPGTKERECVYQLPRKLLRRIIGFSTEESDLVLDLFSHSGVCSETAQIMNRKYIAVEQSEYYCTLIQKRLSKNRLF